RVVPARKHCFHLPDGTLGRRRRAATPFVTLLASRTGLVRPTLPTIGSSSLSLSEESLHGIAVPLLQQQQQARRRLSAPGADPQCRCCRRPCAHDARRSAAAAAAAPGGCDA